MVCFITNMSNITVHVLPDATIQTLDDFLELHTALELYDFMYISFGSKHNDPQQHFHWPSKQILETNAIYQMFPQFLRVSNCDSPAKQRTLNIVIDRFSQETMVQNQRILEAQYADVPMDILLLDYTITKTNLPPIIDTLLSFAHHHSISSAKCMFCNYIRFSHPNQQELELEEVVQISIQNRMDYLFDGKYADCFYQWYGPQIYLYHCIYPYKRYNTINLFYSSIIIHILHHDFDSIPFTKSRGSLIEASLKTDAERIAWTLFYRNIVDITAITR